MKIFLVILCAVGIGVGVGFSRNMIEFGGVDEHFSVFRQTLDSEGNHIRKNVVEDPEGNNEAVAVANVLGSTIYKFGQMEKEQTMEHEFWVQNDGNAILTVTLARTSCKCTLSELKGKMIEIQPGEKKPIKLSWKSPNYSKTFHQHAIVETNDPARRSFKLEVEGRVIQPIRPEPEKVVFNSVKTSSSSETRVRLYGYKYDDLSIESAEFADDGSKEFFDVKYSPLSAEDIKKETGALSGYLVVITAKKGLPIGPIKQTLRLNTNKQEIEIPMAGRVRGDFTISLVGDDYYFDEERNLLGFGTISDGIEAEAELIFNYVSKDKKEIEFSVDEATIHPSSKHIKVEILKDKFKKQGRLSQYPIKVTIPKDCPNVSHLENDLAKFTIKTSHENAKTIDIYVRFAKTK